MQLSIIRMMEELPDLCAECGYELEPEEAGEAREPCPVCESTTRTKQAAASLTATGTLRARGQIIRLAWDSISLTLVGIIYGVLVTVAGVVVAVFGSRPAVAIYAVISVGVLILGLIRPRPLIRLAKRLPMVGKR